MKDFTHIVLMMLEKKGGKVPYIMLMATTNYAMK